MACEEVPQFPLGPSDSEPDLAFLKRGPRRGEPDREARSANVERQSLQRFEGRWPHGRHAGGPGLEDCLRERSGDRQGAQEGFERGAEIILGERQDLAQDLTPTPYNIVRLDDGASCGLRQGWKRGRPWHLLGSPPREPRRELDYAGGAGGDSAGGIPCRPYGRNPGFGPEEAALCL
jgi:hypothetical protein